MLDPQDEAYDRRLAKHLVSLYHQTREEEEEELVVSRGRGGGREWVGSATDARPKGRGYQVQYLRICFHSLGYGV